MKTKDELTALKNEVESLNKKLSALTEEELEQVSGGMADGELDLFVNGKLMSLNVVNGVGSVTFGE